VGVLDAFLSTWSKARATFGEGAPQTGAEYDNSATLRQLQTTVESAAPGSKWTGAAANAYGTTNANHAQVLGQLAGLDQRLGAQVNESARVVEAGRRDLDAVRNWVVDAAASVPEGKNREQMLMPIVSKGLGEVSDIFTKSNGDLAKIGGQIRTIGSEYDALGNQKLGTKEGGGDVLGVKGDEGKGEPHPEDTEELVKKALAGDQQAAGKVHDILGTINTDQLQPHTDPGKPGSTAPAKPLTELQSETVGQMQSQMRNMSMSDLNAARDRLGNNKSILSDAMQVMSDPDVNYAHKSGAGLMIPGQDGWLPGGGTDLPTGVQDTLNEKLHLVGPAEGTTPGRAQPVNIPFADTPGAHNLSALADIVGDGDPRLQQGSALDHGLMSRAGDVLGAEGTGHWGDDVVEKVFDTAGRDTVVDHDMLTQNQGFVHDVMTHPWHDGGASASTLTDWIHDGATSANPDLNVRAGETSSALASFMDSHKDQLMNFPTEGNAPLGQVNPELTKSLAAAMSPYVDEMAGHNIDNTSGFKQLDGSGDLSYPHATNVFSVLDTSPDAADIINQRSTEVQSSYINQFADSAIHNPDHPADSSLMEDAGRLKGITQMGALNASNDLIADDNSARKAAHDMLGRGYDLAVTAVETVPAVGPALGLGSAFMRDAIVGPDPATTPLNEVEVRSSDGMRTALAQTFINHGMGSQQDITGLAPHYNDTTQQWELQIPAEDHYSNEYDNYRSALNNFFTNISGPVGNAVNQYNSSYDDVIR
jgi:EspA/EspE family